MSRICSIFLQMKSIHIWRHTNIAFFLVEYSTNVLLWLALWRETWGAGESESTFTLT